MADPLTNTDLFTQVLAILSNDKLNDRQALCAAIRLGVKLWVQQQLDELNDERPPPPPPPPSKPFRMG